MRSKGLFVVVPYHKCFKCTGDCEVNLGSRPFLIASNVHLYSQVIIGERERDQTLREQKADKYSFLPSVCPNCKNWRDKLQRPSEQGNAKVIISILQLSCYCHLHIQFVLFFFFVTSCLQTAMIAIYEAFALTIE